MGQKNGKTHGIERKKFTPGKNIESLASAVVRRAAKVVVRHENSGDVVDERGIRTPRLKKARKDRPDALNGSTAGLDQCEVPRELRPRWSVLLERLEERHDILKKNINIGRINE